MPAIRIAIVQGWPTAISETFIRAHAERLPGVSTVFHAQDSLPAIDGKAVLDQSWGARAIRKGVAVVFRRELRRRVDRAWESPCAEPTWTSSLRSDGTTGAFVAEPCTRIGVPFVVHFHGFDATKTATIQRCEARAPAYVRLRGRRRGCFAGHGTAANRARVPVGKARL